MIRLAKLSEIQEIVSMTRTCAAKMISEGIHQWNEHYPNIEAFQKDIARQELFVYIVAERIAGCIAISSEKDAEYEPVKWLTEDGDQLYIHRLAVHPDFQHQGLARKLMDFAEAYAKKRKAVSIRLDTFSVNKRNNRFYEARGYHRLGDVYFPKQSDLPFHCYELVLKY